MSRYIGALLLTLLLTSCGMQEASADTVYRDAVDALQRNDRARIAALAARPLSDHLDLVLERVQAQAGQPTFATVELLPLTPTGVAQEGVTIWRSQDAPPRCWRAKLARLAEGWRMVQFDLTDRQCPAQ